MPLIGEKSLFAALAELKSAWPGGPWTWDGRMFCATSSFGLDLAGKAQAAIVLALPELYTRADLKSAPDPMRDLVAKAGGLRAGQILFVGEPAFGLWWPWGSGTTISLRVGLIGAEPAGERRLRELFGV